MAPTFLTAEWRRLLMLNFPIDPKELRKHTPRGTEIDTWNGETYISLVAFSFLNTRIKGVAVPFHRDFEEINLRFYVRSRGPEGWRRGVVFVREVVPRLAIASIARWLYNENYVACPMDSRVVDPSEGQGGSVEYRWRHRGQWLSIRGRFTGVSVVPRTDSQEEFITEHYWGYSKQRDGGTVEYKVEHPQWRVWPVTDAELDGPVASFYGPEFASALGSQPCSSFVADGSPVIVRKGKRIDKRIARLLGLALLVTAVGCVAHKPPSQQAPASVGTSQMDHFAPPTSSSPRIGKRPPLVIPPRPTVQSLPIYPKTALDDAVACVARILYHVEMSGEATLVRLEWDEPPPVEHLVDFEEAIGAAVAEWKFHAAFRIIPETQDDGSIEPVQKLLPKALHALIRFRVENGAPIVE